MGQEPEELRADIEERRDRMSETVDAIGDRVSPSRIAQRRVERTKGWVGGVRERVMGTMPSPISAGSSPGAIGQVKATAQGVAGTVSDVPDTIGRQTQGNPLIAGALAFGVGILVASLLPETESEQRVVEQVQPQLEAATDAVKQVAQDTAGSLKDSAADAAQELKDSATEKAQVVKDQATSSAQQVKEAASGPGNDG